jgi:hypothetical protein
VLFNLPCADLVVETLRLAMSVLMLVAVIPALSVKHQTGAYTVEMQTTRDAMSTFCFLIFTRFLKFLVFLDVFSFFHMRILALI